MNLTALNGKRKGELHAFFGPMLSKIYGKLTFAWVWIEGCAYSASFSSPGSCNSSEAPSGGPLLGNGNLGVADL